ncbi:hypothetical protein SAY87_011224 [Trapa incisa]|uniref:Uncharacterized protein n=2 Tax=Trapa TaxID=22665 RepID=A0AAN7LXJ0_TRANT|nr:hypothetical protein SAY87_011224 [Trapa incisa]KAK4794715.1 hypothetical protein SAY86_012709 [Trapa natans]
MEAKQLTKEALALTEKKMDMALDDIIKMSKTKTAKGKRARVPNKSQRSFNNAAEDKSMKLRGFVNSRSLVRQGVFAQKRSNFRQNQFLPTNEVGWKATVAPFNSKVHHRDMIIHSNKARPRVPLSTSSRSSDNTTVISKQQQDAANGASNLQKQTLDARFANLKEQRIQASALPRPSNSTTHHRNRRGSHKQIPPWTRYPK